jgi:hypothetical protein
MEEGLDGVALEFREGRGCLDGVRLAQTVKSN